MRAAKVDANQRAVDADAWGVWSCAECGKEARATVHQKRKTYCSMDCMAKGYATRLRGEANPNHKNIQPSICQHCGTSFECKTRDRKFCSHACYATASRVREDISCAHCAVRFRPQTGARKFCSAACMRAARPKKQHIPKPKSIHITACECCGIEFRSSPSCNRKFCSYPCFKNSGGPQRAGESAVMAISKYGAKKDANHSEVFAELERHIPVIDLSHVGFGMPDGIANIGGRCVFFDVKNPATGYGKRGLNDRQKRFANELGVPIYLIYSKEDAAKFASGDLQSVRFYDGQVGAA